MDPTTFFRPCFNEDPNIFQFVFTKHSLSSQRSLSLQQQEPRTSAGAVTLYRMLTTTFLPSQTVRPLSGCAKLPSPIFHLHLARTAWQSYLTSSCSREKRRCKMHLPGGYVDFRFSFSALVLRENKITPIGLVLEQL